MFGHQDNTDTTLNAGQGSGDQDINKLIDDLNNTPQASDSPVAADPVVPSPAQDPSGSMSPTATPAITPSPVSEPAPSQPTTSSPVNLPDQTESKPVDLVELKTKALDELYPIVHKLDLSAEDNFKTLMMMIQATDNKDLIGQAYETAEKIEDEAVRARALLDIVNEINYFTNHPVIDK